jgi:KipI family sensor histidine kinase inhibitor
MGATAILIDEVADPAALARAIAESGAPVVDVVPAARTVLVTAADSDDIGRVRAMLDLVSLADREHRAFETVTIDVRYDGDDLAEVADTVGLTIDEVIDVHSTASYRVEFCGFSPGFGYLSGLPDALHLPRRATPRTRVPAGSVAVAAQYAAVYPTPSPGGWHLLGSTQVQLFDPHRSPPALLTPGTHVVFRPT